MVESNDVPAASTQMDDAAESGQTEQQLLDAVLANSQFTNTEEVPLPAEETDEVDPATDDTIEQDQSEDVVSENEEEATEEVIEEDAVEAEEAEAATEESATYTADDLDLDAKVLVKVDGNELEVSMGDLLKGYQTDAHLSKKGREIGDAQKALDEQQASKLAELDQLGETAAAIVGGAEQAKSKQYHELEAAIVKARKEGDTFEVNELKDKREQVQKEYWDARNHREKLTKTIEERKAKAQEESWQAQISYFKETIPTIIPDFNEQVAKDIREFALAEGIRTETLNQITDPVIVKFVDDYRRLKNGVNKGVARRKVIPSKKAIPAKKAKPVSKKSEEAAAMRKARAFKSDSSADQQMDYLRDIANKTLSNL